MEIGLDYMHVRGRAQHYGLRWAGIGMLVAGIGLLVAGGIYYGYIFSARGQAEDYAAQRSDVVEATSAEVRESAANGRTIRDLALPAGTEPEAMDDLGFLPVLSTEAAPLGTQSPATRLTVTGLGIDTKVGEESGSGVSVLGSATEGVGEGGEEVANPGESGAVWFRGSSSLSGDGFGGLTAASKMLSDNREVLIIVSNGEVDYLYLATHLDVVEASRLQLSSTDRATVHLAAPIPQGPNDFYMVLSGELVGARVVG